MRNDHVFDQRLGHALLSQEELEQSVARARRMRSEVFHQLLTRALARIGNVLRPVRSPRALQGC
jgi:hypothetical protein